MAGTAPKTMPSPCRARRPRKRAGGCSTSPPRAGTTSPDSRRRPHHPLRYSSNSRRPGAPRTARRPRSLGSRRHSGSARSRCSRGSRSAWRCPQARQTLAARWQRTRIDGSPDTCRPRRTRSKRSPRRRRSSRLHLLDEQPLAVARAPSFDRHGAHHQDQSQDDRDTHLPPSTAGGAGH